MNKAIPSLLYQIIRLRMFLKQANSKKDEHTLNIRTGNDDKKLH